MFLSCVVPMQSCEEEYRKSVAEGRATDRDKFVYGWHLIKSKYRDDVRKGIQVMGGGCGHGSDATPTDYQPYHKKTFTK